jgi:hypothetical protein
MEKQVIARLSGRVKADVGAHLAGLPISEVASVDGVESFALALGRGLIEVVFEAWGEVLESVARKVGLACPSCQQPRKVKRRGEAKMEIQVLGLKVAVPKLYLECTCGAKGVSITRLLTGLSSGDSSSELALRAAYCASQQSYGQASRDLEVHSGSVVGRTTVRHLALTVEHDAMEFVEKERGQALIGISHEARKEGVARLMVQGDGGMVRTGTLVPCKSGDPNYAKRTLKTGRLRRRRPTQYRELMTFDVRQPEEMTASALDVVVPVLAPEGERARRMLALAARKGLGDNTEVFGVGDLGSQLPESFDEAFAGNVAQYSGDWKHTCDYVYGVAAVLVSGAKRWTNQMKDAIWKRARPRVDRLLEWAEKTRVELLPPSMEKCPVHALQTYLENNWERLHAAEFKKRGLDFVSARAEAQVRDRTKARFDGPGAWNEGNLEGKATLRAIIAEGRWEEFRQHYLNLNHTRFHQGLTERIQTAIHEGRLTAASLTRLASPTSPQEGAAAA